MREQQDRGGACPSARPGCRQQIGELDGSMVPIVTSGNEAGDKRKHKTLQWQEARLVLVHAHGSVTPKFAATFGGSVEESGRALRARAVAAGFGATTQVTWGRGRRAVDSGAIRHDVWSPSQLSGRFLPCLRLSG